MSLVLDSANTVVVEDSVRESASDFIQKQHDRKVSHFMLSLEDGDTIELPLELSGLLMNIIKGLTKGPLTVTSMPTVLTSSLASEILGISRPTLIKKAMSGEIPATQVGSHWRFVAQDIFEIRRKKIQAQLTAFDELRKFDEQFDIQ